MRSPLFALCLATWFALWPWRARAEGAEAAGEKLLLGFEDEEIRKFDKLLFGQTSGRSEATSADGKTTVTLKIPFPSSAPWSLQKGNASQGQFSIAFGGVQPEKIVLPWHPPGLVLPSEPQYYYGLFHNPACFHTTGLFRRLFPKDWSEYGLLRLDVWVDEIPHTIRILLEDEDIAPPVARDYAVPPEKWTTLELDLRAAQKERGLNLKQLATLTIGIVKVQGTFKKQGNSGRLDNLRLCNSGAPAPLPVVRDPRPHELPAYYKGGTKPQPEKLPEGTPDRTPLTAQTPIRIPTEQVATVSPVGWVAAYDNRQLLVGFGGQGKAQVLQSVDAGKSWRGLDGTEKPSIFFSTPYLDHQSGHGGVVGARAETVFLSSVGCFGTAFATMRLWCHKLDLTPTGWRARAQPTLMDCDTRHCTSNDSVIRTADGRLWGAYGLSGRLGRNQINLRYSDDDGLIWKGSREGTSGLIPGTNGGDDNSAGFGYTFEEPILVPFGPAVACFWQERAAAGFGKLKWTRFDGKSWSPFEEVPQPKWTVYPSTASRPYLYAVSLDGKEIFLVSSFHNGVQHYREGKWNREAEDVPPGSRISLAGNKTVMVVGALNDVSNPKRVNEFFGDAGSPKLGPVAIKVWQRKTDGTWAPAKEVAREEEPLYCDETQYAFRPGFIVPPVAPPNFVPVAWSTGKNWIKYLRVPVTE